MDRFLEFIREKLSPNSNFILSQLEVWQQTEIYHAASSFIAAHHRAQNSILEYFHAGDDAAANPSVERLTVYLESETMVHDASVVLEGLSSSLISVIKSKLVSEIVLHRHETYIHHLISRGVLTMSDAEEAIKRIYSTRNKVGVLINTNIHKSEKVIHSEIAVWAAERARTNSCERTRSLH
jgi:hypothetical protein